MRVFRGLIGENEILSLVHIVFFCLRALCCVERVLKPGGRYILLSYGQPDYRLGYLEDLAFDWKIAEVQDIKKPAQNTEECPDPADKHYCYVMTKCEE